mgnify:CR=1 FL=1
MRSLLQFRDFLATDALLTNYTTIGWIIFWRSIFYFHQNFVWFWFYWNVLKILTNVFWILLKNLWHILLTFFTQKCQTLAKKCHILQFILGKTLQIALQQFLFVKNGILLPKLFWLSMKKKIVLVIEKNVWNSRLKAENLQTFWDPKNNLFKQLLVTKCFFNMFLEVSHI